MDDHTDLFIEERNEGARCQYFSPLTDTTYYIYIGVDLPDEIPVGETHVVKTMDTLQS